MASSPCSLRKTLSVFGPIVVLAAFLGHGFLSLVITSIVLTLSTLLFKFSNQKPDQKDEILVHPEDGKSITEDVELIPEESEEKVEEVEEILPRTSVSEQSESLGRSSSTSEDSEVLEWMSQGRVSRSPDWSDGSISDEESLIEIELPGGHFVGNNKEEEEEEEEEYCKKKIAETERLGYSYVKVQQNGFLELFQEWSDMNEEENLIEIDISVGSIKVRG